MIVILAASMVEARYWKSHYMAAIPELAEAREVSAGGIEQGIEGMRVWKLYIAPGAQKGSHFEEVHGALLRNLWRDPDYVEPIYLGGSKL